MGITGVSTQVVAMNTSPALRLARKGQNVSQVRMLKMAREQCLSEKRMHLDIRRTKPQLWVTLEQDMQTKRKGYDINRAISPEPEGAKVAIQRDEEYFDGEKYAYYSDGSRYRLAGDGSCALLADKTRSAQLDDGKPYFDLDLIKRTGVKKPSPVALHRQYPAVNQDKTTASNNDTVAGQRCDYLSGAKHQRTKVFYWSTLHRYPSVIQRPVVLKSVVIVGNDVNSEQAVLFEQPGKIDGEILQAPKRILPKDLSLR
jgi:hypothetical protein